MKVAFLVDNVDLDNDAIYHWRVNRPVAWMKMSVDAQIIDVDQQIPADAHLAVFPRTIVTKENREPFCDLIRDLHDQGTKVVYDTDDDMFSESYIEYMTDLYGKQHYDRVCFAAENNKWLLEQVDFVTVSTTALANTVTSHTSKPVYCIPNAIDVKHFSKGLKTNNELQDKIVIGWAGGARPLHELKPMLDGWELLAKERDDVRFRIAGYHPPLEGYEHFIRKSRYIPWTSVNNYASSMQVDIGCVTVKNTPFTQCKSPNKAWEFIVAGAIVVGSGTPYYYEPVIMTGQTSDDWYQMLDHVITHRKELEVFKTHALNHVMTDHDMRSEWWKWYDAYDDMLGGVFINAVDSE